MLRAEGELLSKVVIIVPLKARSHNAISCIQLLTNSLIELSFWFRHNSIKESYDTNCIASCEPAVVGQLLRLIHMYPATESGQSESGPFVIDYYFP